METQDSIQHGLPVLHKDSVAPSVESRTIDAEEDTMIDDGIRSSPPAMPEKRRIRLDAVHRSPEDKAAKSDSEAETIVLPGKNGYSPSKRRKTIKHEDQSEEGEIREEENNDNNEIRDGLAELKGSIAPSSGNNMYSSLGKRKRTKQGKIKDDQGNSSGLSSLPTSPVASRSKATNNKNDSDHSRSPSPHAIPRKANSVDIVLSRQSVHDASSGDERETRKYKRQQSVGEGIDSSAQRQHENHRTSKSHSKSGEKTRKHTRSESPPPRTHRRISSGQTGVINGLSHKKKRVPAPLLATRDRQSTDYHSDESSASGSPHPRSSRLRKLTTPATAESSHSVTMPPGKMAKNRRDGIGRTPLARACATDDFNAAKEILSSSLDDLNTADNAGNTPLQIACLEGHADVVKLLIDHGCDINRVNLDKDTPLLDAVENGHLDVVRLLIDAGVNPRRGNVKGEEPLDRIPLDMDNSEEIRQVLIAARLKSAEIRKPSEDLSTHDNDDHSSRGTNSPRPSPPMQLPEDSYPGRRRRTNVRSTKTSNKLLHQSMDTKTLRHAAETGDTETVNRILQVRDGMADTESLVMACRGGHEDVIQLLLAIGGADADPQPLPKSKLPADAATPMLAAIGREKVEVVKLLLDQPNFNPTKTFNNETYFEIARRRQGARWKEEEEILKEAHRKYTGESKQSSSRIRSPELRRDLDRNGKRSNDRVETTSPSRKSKNTSPEVPHNDIEPKLKTRAGTIDGAKRELKRSSPTVDTQLKVSPGHKKSIKHKEEHPQSTQLSDRECAGLGPPRTKVVKKRSESDTPHPSSDNDPVKPRRKLISGKELKGEKEKQRRESVASTASNSLRDRSESKIGDSNKMDAKSTPGTASNFVEPDLGMDKVLDRPRTLKRDDSKDRLGAIRGESPSKRPRESSTPPRAGSHDSTRTAEDSGVPAKKRRLDSESHVSSSPDNRPNSSLLSSENARSKANNFAKDRHRQGSMASQGHGKPPEGHPEARKNHPQNKLPANSPPSSQDTYRSAEKPSNSGAPYRGQREPTESKENAKVAERKAADEREAKIKAEREERSRYETEKTEAERKRLEAEKIAAEELKRKETEKAAAEELKRKEAEKAEAEERARHEAQAKLEEEQRKQRAEMERQAMIAERRAREEEQAREHEAKLRQEAKLKQEETERKERQAREDAEARQRAEEENRRLYLEQEQKKREEAERKRAAREAEALAERERQRERQEAERRAKLPQLLQSFEMYAKPQTSEFASLFAEFWGVRYDTMVYDATGPEAKELWILNTQVAFLLGLNDKHDLQLSRFTGWDRVPASNIAKDVFCRLEGDRYACSTPALRFLNPEGRTKGMRTHELRNQACRLFMNMNLFFVKLSDFMFIVDHFPHLHNIKMRVRYKELPKPDGSEWDKWKEEPGAGPFYPQGTYYMNGQLVGEDKPTIAQGSPTPFPRPMPTAPIDPDNGLLRLHPANPRYLELCRDQGLWHLLPPEEREAALPNGTSNERPSTSNGNGATIGFTPSPSVPSESGKSQAPFMQDTPGSPRLVNGINGDSQQHNLSPER